MSEEPTWLRALYYLVSKDKCIKHKNLSTTESIKTQFLGTTSLFLKTRSLKNRFVKSMPSSFLFDIRKLPLLTLFTNMLIFSFRYSVYHDFNYKKTTHLTSSVCEIASFYMATLSTLTKTNLQAELSVKWEPTRCLALRTMISNMKFFR